MKLKFAAWSLVSMLGAVPLSAQRPAERDWSAALRLDAQALHDDIAANHPGPVNSGDPGFAKRNDAQLALALERARDARSYADYFFALREYVASFDDGHMGFGAYGDTPNDFRWPGFLTEYDSRGKARVFTSDEPGVPIGAELVECDGLSSEAYGAATLGKMWGRWKLQSQRLNFGRSLFLDEGSRYVPHAANCSFRLNGGKRSVALDWRPIGFKEFNNRVEAVGRHAPRAFAARVADRGTRYYSIPSFNADPQSEAGKALPAMIAGMGADRDALAAAPAIVLDLRGNGGGSSDWSRQIAEQLWGKAALDRLSGPEVHVDWRVSRANLESIEQSYARQKAGGALSPHMTRWFETTIAGLKASLARGDSLWRHPDEESDETSGQDSSPDAPVKPLGGRVCFITDAHCGSACLDAVDLWRQLGAIHVGQTTSADTLYMDVRQARLPSGITGVAMPMKVYRGRPRGSNEPVVPVRIFDGDIDDDAALEKWIAALVGEPIP